MSSAAGSGGGDKLTRIAIVEGDKCKPKKCRQECKRSCPVVRMGKLCIEVAPTSKNAFISEELCIGCGICVKKCPFDAIQIINLPKSLEKDTTHRYGPNSFKLHRLPMPRPGHVLGLVGTNGIGKCFAKDTALLMYDGSCKAVQTITARDVLMGDDCTPRYVVANSFTSGRAMMYNVRAENDIANAHTVNGDHVLVLIINATTPSVTAIDERTFAVRQWQFDDEARLPLLKTLRTFASYSEARFFVSELSIRPLIYEISVDDYLTRLSVEAKQRSMMFKPDVITYFSDSIGQSNLRSVMRNVMKTEPTSHQERGLWPGTSGTLQLRRLNPIDRTADWRLTK